MNDGGEAIRGLLQGGQGMGGASYAGAGKPFGMRPWYMDPGSVFGLSDAEKADLQGLGVDMSGMGIIPVADVNDYRSAKSLGEKDFAMWKQMKQDQARKRLFQGYSGAGSRVPGYPGADGSFGARR